MILECENDQIKEIKNLRKTAQLDGSQSLPGIDALILAPLRSQHFTWQCARGGAVFNDHFAIDDRVRNSYGVLNHACFIAG